jgi:hypothetical protein
MRMRIKYSLKEQRGERNCFSFFHKHDDFFVCWGIKFIMNY